MKKMNFINRILLLALAMVFVTGGYAQTSFNSFEIKSGFTGFSCGNLAFRGNDITVEFWINAPSAAIATNSEIMESWHDPNGIRINMNAHEGAYALRLFAKSTTSVAASIVIPTEYYEEKWAHIAYIISSVDEKAYAYVNGEYFAEVNMAGGYYGNYRTNDGIRALSVAKAYYGTPVFNGKLADVRIWSAARTAEEIKANYNKHLEGTQENLYLNYTFFNCLAANNKPLINDANTGANNTANLSNTYLAKAVLVQVPTNVAIAGNTLTWDATNATDAYEVQIVDETGVEVSTTPVTANSLALDALLPSDGIYAAKVRTKSFINSDDLFIYSRWSAEVQCVSNASIDLDATGNFKAWTMSEGQTGGNGGLITFPEESNPSARNLTVEFWLNMAEGILNDGTTIFNTSGNGTSGFAATVRNNNGLCQLRLFAKNSDNSESITLYIPSEHYVNKWAHVAFVVSETDNKAYLYLNGEPFGDEATATGGWNGNNHNTSLVLGSAPAGWADPKFYGSLADFRVWSVARTATEIKDNYNKLIAPQDGLHINYTFADWNGGVGAENKIVNVANPGTNDLTLNGNNHFRTVLAAIPSSITFSDNTLSWDATAGEWEVSVFKKDDNSNVFTDMVTVNSIALNDLDELEGDINYYAKVRTLNNGFWSGLVNSDDFMVTKTITNLNEIEKDITFYVNNGSLIVNVEKPQILNIYSVSGQLVRSLSLVTGENVVSGLAKGFYLANNHKIIIK